MGLVRLVETTWANDSESKASLYAKHDGMMLLLVAVSNIIITITVTEPHVLASVPIPGPPSP